MAASIGGCDKSAMMAGEQSATEPMEVSSMAQRLCFGERTRIEAMCATELGVDEMADRLGRHRSTVYRELDRGGGRGCYRAGRSVHVPPRRFEPRIPGF